MNRKEMMTKTLFAVLGLLIFFFTLNYIGRQWEYQGLISTGRITGISLRSTAHVLASIATVAASALTATVLSAFFYFLLKKNKMERQRFWFTVDAAGVCLVALALIGNRIYIHQQSLPKIYRDYDSTGKLLEPDKYLGRLKTNNIILISIDTLNPKHLHCYGYEHETSPTLDQLAAESVLFTSAFSQAPKTSESHMTMFTSLYPSVHKIRNWNTYRGGYSLDHRAITITEILKNAGYATAAFTGGGNVEGSIGFSHGFDVYDNHDQLWERAFQWLHQHHQQNFFLFLHTFKVHSPYLPPPPYNTMFDPDYAGRMLDSKEELDQLHAQQGGAFPGYHELFWSLVDKSNSREVAHLVALYDGGIRFMDEQLMGALLKKLRALGIYDDTLIIFTSDHGEEFLEHGGFLHKELYDEHLHVPLVIKFPQGAHRGMTVTEQVRTIDLMPTILEYLGLPTPEMAQGKSILPLLDKEEMELPAFAERIEISDTPDMKKMIRTPTWKYIYWPTLGTHELYDLAADPGEQKNLYDQSPEAREEFQAEIDAWMKANASMGESLRARKNDFDEKTIAKLRSLGYVK